MLSDIVKREYKANVHVSTKNGVHTITLPDGTKKMTRNKNKIHRIARSWAKKKYKGKNYLIHMKYGSKHLKKSDLTNRFYCRGCNVTYVSKSDTAQCSCGKNMGRILRESNIGKAIKIQRYSDVMTHNTEFFDVNKMTKMLGAEVMEMKTAMLRKYGDLAINDRVRISKCVADKIISAIEKYGPQKLDDASKSDISGMQGTVTGFNARKNEVTVTWDKGVMGVVGKYNTAGFDFFDLAGKWSDWDLDRIIQMGDVGLPGTVNREGGNIAAGEMATSR
jgi:hypothetical protein